MRYGGRTTCEGPETTRGPTHDGPVLCLPALAMPEHVITLDETLALAERLHADHPRLAQVLSMIENTGVVKRHLVRPLDATLRHTGFEERNLVFEQEAHKR